MNLRTHTAYPEIQIDENHIAQVKIYDEAGKVVKQDILAGKDRAEALKKAKAFVAVAAILFKREDV